MTCPLCRHETSTPFAETNSFGYPVHYVKCLNCGLVHQPAGTTQAADPTFYEETYRKVYQSDERPIPKDLKIQEMRARHLTEAIKTAQKGAIEKALDVGASAGVLLDVFQNEFSCETSGVEPGRAYREYAAEKGHAMYSTLEEVLQSRPGPFQLVSLIHVIEHLEDPAGMLRSIRKNLLSEDGLLLLEVPNFYAHDSFELAHLACYTPHTFRQLVLQAGFEIMDMKTHGYPRSDILGLYLTIIAKPAASASIPPLQSERGVKTKRKIAMLHRKVIQKLIPNRAWLPLPQ